MLRAPPGPCMPQSGEPPTLSGGSPPSGDDGHTHLSGSKTMGQDAEVQRLESLLRETRREVEQGRAREDDAQSKIATLESMIAKDKGVVAEGEAKHQTEIQKLQERLQAADRCLAGLSHSLSVAEMCHEEMRALLQARTIELEEARLYLTKIDDVDDHDVLEIVRTINSHIYQTACAIARAYQEWCGNPRNNKVAERVRRETRVLDGHLILVTRRLEYRQATNGLLLQLALQTAMVSFLQSASAFWGCPATGSSSTSCKLQELYRRIRVHEPQSISARWRVLSRTYLESSENADDLRHQMRDNLLHDVVDVLLSCSVSNSRPTLEREVDQTYRGAFDEIILLTLKFRRFTGMSIVSRDLKIVSAESGGAFDVRWMQNGWTESKKKRSSRRPSDASVLCTTQLGLVREEIEESSGKQQGESKEVVLLKAQVALAEVLDELSYGTRRNGETGK
ncbi:hypothetical protein OH76DRAFT_1407051 [Lentinus brumalis]|uniref:Uncharacterized protein n=1 Tax=Lentinus brumalis TaxID=2498619 RepID=A0A371D1A2_9APHY|nr:hypothetical protein OH76DRAFT_1407051 [Polyporus brumalis]